MPPKRAPQQPVDVVTIDSSDDDDSAPVLTARNPTPPPQPRQKASEQVAPPVGAPNLECRSFWKAGGYEIGPIARRAPAQGELEHARVHPKFLHSNATSHKWAFGAIAELLDNAVDEIHNGATFVKIDKVDIVKDNSPALLFLDDGGGMDPDAIRKCMSLGYSSKKSNTTIGQYGNGFKTSTMRLGADVIVFSRATCASKATQSVGLLSYTFLRKTGQDDVIVPMIDFDISGSCAEPIIYSSKDDWSSNLKTILEWSPFASKDDLMQQFEDIGRHGTKIIIYNLWLNDEGIYELSFDDDDEDIRLRDETNPGDQIKIRKTTAERQSHISYQLRYSLRAYASILYLRKFKKFNILLRGKPVQQFNIADEMKHMKKVAYKPQGAVASNEVTVQTIIGFVKEAPALAVCGFNVYHKNRLIRPFWKVIGDGSARGNGVVGVLEANFIEPAHDKQDFERSSLFIRLEARLRHILLDYWKNHCHLVGHATPGSSTRNIQSGATTKTQKQLPASQRSVGLPAHVQEEANLDQPTSSIPTDLSQHMSNGHHVSNVRDESSVATVPGSTSIEQMCEENIQLFMRCEEYMQQETELKVTVEQLEKELEQEKRKCEQLAAHIEVKRKQRSMREQTGKVS